MDRTSSRIRFENVSDILKKVILLPTKIKSLQHSLCHVANTKQKEKPTKNNKTPKTYTLALTIQTRRERKESYGVAVSVSRKSPMESCGGNH